MNRLDLQNVSKEGCADLRIMGQTLVGSGFLMMSGAYMISTMDPSKALTLSITGLGLGILGFSVCKSAQALELGLELKNKKISNQQSSNFNFTKFQFSLSKS